MLTAKYAKFKCGRTPPGTEAKRDFIVTFPLAEVLFRPYLSVCVWKRNFYYPFFKKNGVFDIKFHFGDRLRKVQFLVTVSLFTVCRLRVDGRPIRKKIAFSKKSAYVCTYTYPDTCGWWRWKLTKQRKEGKTNSKLTVDLVLPECTMTTLDLESFFCN